MSAREKASPRAPAEGVSEHKPSVCRPAGQDEGSASNGAPSTHELREQSPDTGMSSMAGSRARLEDGRERNEAFSKPIFTASRLAGGLLEHRGLRKILGALAVAGAIFCGSGCLVTGDLVEEESPADAGADSPPKIVQATAPTYGCLALMKDISCKPLTFELDEIVDNDNDPLEVRWFVDTSATLAQKNTISASENDPTPQGASFVFEPDPSMPPYYSPGVHVVTALVSDGFATEKAPFDVIKDNKGSDTRSWCINTTNCVGATP